jgi:hypothetical protein
MAAGAEQHAPDIVAITDRFAELELAAEVADERWRHAETQLHALDEKVDVLSSCVNNDALYFGPAGDEVARLTQLQQRLQSHCERMAMQSRDAVAAGRACIEATRAHHYNAGHFLVAAIDGAIAWLPVYAPLPPPGVMPRVDLANPTLGDAANNVRDDAPPENKVIISPFG